MVTSAGGKKPVEAGGSAVKVLHSASAQSLLVTQVEALTHEVEHLTQVCGFCEWCAWGLILLAQRQAGPVKHTSGVSLPPRAHQAKAKLAADRKRLADELRGEREGRERAEGLLRKLEKQVAQVRCSHRGQSGAAAHWKHASYTAQGERRGWRQQPVDDAPHPPRTHAAPRATTWPHAHRQRKRR
jgi:hypothetical protein